MRLDGMVCCSRHNRWKWGRRGYYHESKCANGCVGGPGGWNISGANSSTTGQDGGLRQTSTGSSYPGSVSALVANDANPQTLAVENIEADALLRKQGVRTNRKEWRTTVQGQATNTKPPSVTAGPTNHILTRPSFLPPSSQTRTRG